MVETDSEFIGPTLYDKQCNKCNQVRRVTCFPLGGGSYGRIGTCKKCISASRKAWKIGTQKRASELRTRYSSQEEKDSLPRSVSGLNRKIRMLRRPAQSMLWRAKKRAKALNREFSITEADIYIPESCPVLGIPMFSACGTQPTHNSPSLDRIDSSCGYVPGNVAVISYRANTLKRDATIAELEAIVAYMKANLPVQRDRSQSAA